MMKILYLSNSKFPNKYANTLQTIKTCYSLSKYTDSVYLLSRRGKKRYSRNHILNYYNIPTHSSLHLHQIKYFNFLKNLKGWNYFFNIIQVIFSLFFIILKRPSVFYSRQNVPIIFLSFFCFLFKIKILYEIHNYSDSIIDNFFDRIAVKVSNRVIFITKNLENYFIEKLSFSNKKSVIIPDGVDINQFSEKA